MTEDRGWAVVSEEGLTILVNLTAREAKNVAMHRRSIDKGSWAVTMQDASELQEEWTRLGEDAKDQLRLKRLERVTEFLLARGPA